MTYTPNPTDPTQPPSSSLAGDMYLELQQLKQYIKSFLTGGSKRNLLMNAQMNIDQINRGTAYSFAYNTSGYSIDGWQVTFSGTSGTSTAQQIPGGPFTINNCLSIVCGSGTTVANVFQNIEADLCQGMLLGTAITVSGWVYKSNISSVVSVGLNTASAGVNDFSAITVVGALTAVSVPSAGTWTFFSQTFTLTGAATTGLQLIFNVTNMGGSTFNLTNVQLEMNSYATPLQVNPIQVDLINCQQYLGVFNPQVEHYAAAGTYCSEFLPGSAMFTSGVSSKGAAGLPLLNVSALTYGNCTAGYSPYTGPVYYPSQGSPGLFIPVTVTNTGAYYLTGKVIVQART